ncbi:MAG: hypothetical protein V4726_21595 [Verrucomicrobiota bacterium]
MNAAIDFRSNDTKMSYREQKLVNLECELPGPALKPATPLIKPPCGDAGLEFRAAKLMKTESETTIEVKVSGGSASGFDPHSSWSRSFLSFVKTLLEKISAFSARVL